MQDIMPEPNLNDTDHAILDTLTRGNNVAANIADGLDVSRQYVHQRLKILEAADYVENIGSGVYTLLDDPRTDEERASATNCHEAVLGARTAISNAINAMSMDNGQEAHHHAENALEILEQVDV